MWHCETRWRRLEPEVGSTTAPLSDLFAVPRPSLAADENRHRAHRQHLGCLAPQQQFGQPAAAVRRHEDQVAAVAPTCGNNEASLGLAIHDLGKGCDAHTGAGIELDHRRANDGVLGRAPLVQSWPRPRRLCVDLDQAMATEEISRGIER